MTPHKAAACKFIWTGYGENMRVLDRVIDRIEGKATGVDQPLGVSPTYEELNWTGLDFTKEQFNTVTSIDKAAWTDELKLHDQLFTKLAYHLPKELSETKDKLAKAIAG